VFSASVKICHLVVLDNQFGQKMFLWQDDLVFLLKMLAFLRRPPTRRRPSLLKKGIFEIKLLSEMIFEGIELNVST